MEKMKEDEKEGKEEIETYRIPSLGGQVTILVTADLRTLVVATRDVVEGRGILCIRLIIKINKRSEEDKRRKKEAKIKRESTW